MITVIILALAVISILWAVWSLRELRRDKKIESQIKKKLSKGRVIYHHGVGKSYDSSSDSDSS
ncbi:MAG: hypothetical protein HYT83_03560 [Candidatus Levybacteria bacterium]|nr:hypothetical protein [Candidatus Levybacteria bacterium]